VLAAKCAGIQLYLIFVLTEGDEVSKRMLKQVELRLGSYQILSFDFVTADCSIGWQSSLAEAAEAESPHCSQEDRIPSNFVDRVYCYFEGNPLGSYSCEQCSGPWKAIVSEDHPIIQKMCDNHAFVDYRITDHALG
jgi:hypothetical protein